MAAQEARRRLVRKGAAAPSGESADAPAAEPKVQRDVSRSPATRRSSSAPAARSSTTEKRRRCKSARKKLQAELAKRLAAEEQRSKQKLSEFRAALAKRGQEYRRPEQRRFPDAVSGNDHVALESIASAAELFATMRTS